MSPPPPITNKNPNNRSHLNLHLHQKPTSVPDLLFTALSLLFLFSSSSSSSSSSSKPQSVSFKIPPLCFPQNPRRLFLKNPIMSETKPNPSHFSSPLSLSNWLQSRLPSDSFSSWGIKPGTKNVHNLWLELSEGETSLLDSTPPIRTVNVVSVRIIDGYGRVLLESHQELTDGTQRERNRPLSEKMKPDETVEDAVVRAVKEELGSIIRVENKDVSSIVKIRTGSYQKKVEERVSVSYPGLPACYVLHSVDASVEGLPDDEFCTEEEEYSECSESEVAGKAVHVKKHFWKWVDSDSV